MPEGKFDVGIAGEGGSSVARPVNNATVTGGVGQEVRQGVAQEVQNRSSRRLTRRDLLKAGLGIGVLFALSRACSVGGNYIGAENLLNKRAGPERNDSAESSWGKILAADGAKRLFDTAQFYRNTLSGSQPIESFPSWEGEKTDFGRYIMTLVWFVDDLRTETGDLLDRSNGGNGRKNLITKLNNSKKDLDEADIYIKRVEAVGDYAQRFNLQKMTNEDLKKYFTHVPNPVKENEKYGLGWSSTDWDLLIGMYTAVKNKDGASVKFSLDSRKK